MDEYEGKYNLWAGRLLDHYVGRSPLVIRLVINKAYKLKLNKIQLKIKINMKVYFTILNIIIGCATTNARA
jgi:hypothetical protein